MATDNRQRIMTEEYIVLTRTNAVAKNGSPYITLKVGNLNETFQLMVWDVSPTLPPHVGQIVKFMNITDQQGRKSARGNEMICLDMPFESHPLYNLLPRPIKREQWDETINNLLAFCTNESLKNIIKRFADILFDPYSKYPAATNVHHAFKGGLLNHTYQMLHLLEGMYPVLPYKVNVERCILAIMFHDYGKVYEYSPEGEPTEDMFLLGHIYISAHKLHNELEKEGIAAKEIKRIIHCILAHHGQREFGSPVVPCSQEAMIVTFIDNISAKTTTIEENGNMEKVFALETTIVKD
ncbi:MAG: HD domain-containing protein [Bacteroidaceae bacterium]|nr:HD domain-containing protein [Bacteroidaceae bacterium]